MAGWMSIWEPQSSGFPFAHHKAWGESNCYCLLRVWANARCGLIRFDWQWPGRGKKNLQLSSDLEKNQTLLSVKFKKWELDCDLEKSGRALTTMLLTISILTWTTVTVFPHNNNNVPTSVISILCLFISFFGSRCSLRSGHWSDRPILSWPGLMTLKYQPTAWPVMFCSYVPDTSDTSLTSSII